MATETLEMVALPAMLVVVAVKLAVTSVEILAGEIPEVTTGGILEVVMTGEVETSGMEVAVKMALHMIRCCYC